MAKIFLPTTSEALSPTLSALVQWYDNIPIELGAEFLTHSEKQYMADYYIEAGLLTSWRKPFFRRHFIESFGQAAGYLSASSADGVIVDLGCGTGTQSLLLAMGGARVLGVDLDTQALAIFRKRQLFYEAKLGRKLNIEITAADVFALDYRALGPVRGVYSMFAFNMMQPSTRLLDKLTEAMVPDSRFVVLDGNSKSLFSRLWPGRSRDTLSPIEFRGELARRGVQTESLVGGVVIAPRLWQLLPYGMMAGLDRKLCDNMWMPISHQISGVKST